MPLPDNAPLSLHVHSNAVQSKPKHAMIVRMSAETLDALEAFPNNPPMSFDFGDTPGIYIGDAFFPMRPQKESSPHELYLRAASVAKPMAPLKLYANVIGKFMVERQLGDKVTDKVRHQHMIAKQQHMERHAILLDQPPIPVSGTKHAKRKMPGSVTILNKTPASEHLRIASSSTAPPRKVSPLPRNSPSTKANADVRRRLIRFLAISPRLSDEAVKMVGGANISSSAKDDLLALLQDVAEQRAPLKKGDKSPCPWALKPQTWTEVRPFEWPKLSESERIAIARQARIVFQALKISESDPVWDNVRYRQTASTTPASAASAAKSVASRRLPGSGYQAKKSPQSSTHIAERPATPVDARAAPKPSVPQKPAPAPPQIHEREREKREREKEKEKQREEWEKEQERAEMEKREKARQKERETVEREKRRREKERKREAILNDTASKPHIPKRRKLDDGSSVASSASKVRDSSLPKKLAHEPSPVPRLKTKKDVTPTVQVPAPNHDRRATGGPTHKSEKPSKQSAGAKPRRRSPIYTSSEDEGEIPQPRKRNPSPPSVSDRSISSDQPPSERPPRQQRPTRTAYPPPADHAALRALYHTQYSNYLGTFSKIVAQKRKIEAMLNGDSEAEVDMMDPDDLLKLSNEHKSLKTELENIHEIYTKGTAAAILAGGTTPD